MSGYWYSKGLCAHRHSKKIFDHFEMFFGFYQHPKIVVIISKHSLKFTYKKISSEIYLSTLEPFLKQLWCVHPKLFQKKFKQKSLSESIIQTFSEKVQTKIIIRKHHPKLSYEIMKNLHPIIYHPKLWKVMIGRCHPKSKSKFYIQ